MTPFVVGLVATYRRAPELERMLRSLAHVTVPMALLVVDNADEPDTKAVVDNAPAGMEVVRLVPGANLGCGGGLAYGERAAMELYGERLTHLWPMDDDVEIPPGTLERLLQAMETEGAALACPIITGPDDRIGWVPGLVENKPFRIALAVATPANYFARCGSRPIRFSWAAGVCLLVTRQAFLECGPHRDDFLIRGEDLEWSLRITARFPAVFVPAAQVRHLPRPPAASPEATAAEHMKQGAMLQNIAYISFHLPHGHRILRHLPGNLRRFVKAWGPSGLFEGLSLYWRGAIRGKPAGSLCHVAEARACSNTFGSPKNLLP